MSLNVVVQQFLEAVVHSILYHRNVYPPESFEKTQLYGMVVRQNRHPLVTDYIREVATKATASVQTLSEVRVIICNGDGDDGDGDGDGDGGDAFPDEDIRDVRDTNADPENDRQTEKRKWYRMQDDFKATLLRLEVLCRSQSVPGDPDALSRRTFRMQLVTGPDADRAEDTGDWMVIQRPAVPPGPHRATPVHTVRLAEGTSVSIRME